MMFEKNYWLSDNEQRAAENAFYQLHGYLENNIRAGYRFTSEEILAIMDNTHKRETARLDREYPDRKR